MNGNFFIKVIHMKRLFAALTLAAMLASAFTGCQMVEDASQAVTDAVTGVSEDASEIMDGKNNGAVTDEDGLIDNGDDDNGDVTNPKNDKTGD